MDTGHSQVLAILMIKKAAFQGARGVNSGKSAADTVAVEVCPRLFWGHHYVGISH